MKTYPTGWGREPKKLDEKSAKILLIVNEAGKTLSYKEAAKKLEEETNE